ncbi:PH domain-containing protein [Acidaminococcus fermentans]|uniref:PH domain-containing protein n=1 Tax=Acidaminococcus fermentans TaxID=905 RepID=UPI00242C3D90|nr:PH domain-containing protein [Acidaminococcus fermentans]
MEESNPLQEQPAENEKEEKNTTLTGGAGPEDREAEEGPAQPQETPEIPRGRADRSLMYFFWPLVVMILYVPVGLIWLAYRFLEYKTQLLLLTNKRLVLFKGIIKKKQYMIPLDMAAQMTIEQGFLGRKAGYGTLIIGQGKEAIRYNYVRDPEKFRQLCRTEG